MLQSSSPEIRELGELANAFASRSYSPYSGQQSGCVALLSDGTWVPGVRVENASYPLLISATLNALTTAIAEDRWDFVAFVSSDPISHVERDLLEPFLGGLNVDANVVIWDGALPRLGDGLRAVHADVIGDDASGLGWARRTAASAWTPESDFPVGCILGSSTGGYTKGVNVEHPDWNLGICAERNALGTAITYGLDRVDSIYLSCLKDPAGTPCGACRQVLVEHAAEMRVIMDRTPNPPESTTPAALLPDYFAGETLRDWT
jgi:homotetrameric cytidine deaminase